MKELIEKIENKNNELNIVKSKVRFPQLYSRAETEIQLLKLTNELSDLKKEAALKTEIRTQKKLLFEQLSEYIKVIEKPHQYPFSRKQGLSFDLFYISPLMSVKQIVFLTQSGLTSVIYNLTLDEKDTVKNKNEFLTFLKQKQSEVISVNNLSELYEFYKSFAETIKREFC